MPILTHPLSEGEARRLGQRLRELRSREGLSQAGLARQVKLTQSVQSRLEAGEQEPSAGQLRAFARRFGVTIDYLVIGYSPTAAAATPGRKRAACTCSERPRKPPSGETQSRKARG